MDEVHEMKEPDAVNLNKPLGAEQTFEALRERISTNLDIIAEAVRAGNRETIEKLGVEIERYEVEKVGFEKALEALGERPLGNQLGCAFFDSRKNILEGRMKLLEDYLKVYEQALKSGSTSGMFLGNASEKETDPSFRGVSLRTYELWLEQNKSILDAHYSTETIALFGETIAQYQRDLDEITGTITTLEDKIGAIKYSVDHPSHKELPLLENDVARLVLTQINIQQYLDAYRKVVTRHQEEALSV